MIKTAKNILLVLGGAVIVASFLTLPHLASAQDAKSIGEQQRRELEAEHVITPEQKAQQKELQAAQETQKTSNQVPFQYPKECGWTEITCGALKAVNWLLDALAAVPLSLARSFFVSILGLNFTAFSEGQFLIATTTGWKIVLGLANMFFVLWLLWIAIATIFDFEPFTYRQLLVKVIIAALLINFSFAISTAVIGLANGIGTIFWQGLEQMGGVGNVLAKIGNPDAFVLTVENTYSNQRRDDVLNRQISVPTFYGTRTISARDCPKISKVVLSFPIPGYDTLTTRKLQEECQKLMADAEIAQILNQDNASDIRDAQLAVAAVVKILVYPVAIFALLAAAIFLVIRVVSLMLLIVSAPLAFFMLAIPGGGQAGFGWKEWWQYLFKWSFYLPIFLFLFMLSAIVMNNVAPESFKIAISGKGAFPSAPALFLQYIIGIIFLIVSIIVAKNMSIYGASIVTDWGKDLAKGAGMLASRGVGRTALRFAAPAAKGLEEGTGLAARALRRVPGLTRLAQVTAAAQRGAIGRRKSALKKYSDDELKRLMALRGTTTNTSLAALAELQERRNLRDLPTALLSGLLQTMRGAGMDTSGAERLRPDIAIPLPGETQEQATQRIAASARPADIENMDEAVLTTTPPAIQNAVVQGIIDRAGPDHMRRLINRGGADQLTIGVTNALHTLDPTGHRSATTIAAALFPRNPGLARYLQSGPGRRLFGLNP